MADRQPSPVIRIIADALVSAGVALVVLKLFGKRAGLGAAVFGVVAHEALKTPVANLLAEIIQ